MDLTEVHECRKPTAGGTVPWTVYLVKSGDLHKIGITWNLRLRLRGLRNGSAVPVKHVVHAIVCCGEKARAIERHLHQTYDHARRHGEWFELNEVHVERIRDFLEWTWNDIRRHRRHVLRNERIKGRANARAARFDAAVTS